MGKDAPPAPDYRGAAEAQAQASREVTEQQTWANRPTINTPFGQQTWDSSPTWDPATGQYLNRWTMNTNLTPESQAALDSQMALTMGRSQLAQGLLGRTQEEFGDTMDWSQFQEMGGVPQPGQYNPEQIQRELDYSSLPELEDTGDLRNRVENSIYGRATSRLDPMYQQREGDLRARLYAQGLREGDEAYDREFANLGRERTDAYQTALDSAIMGGGEEAQRQFGMQLGARQQGMGEVSSAGTFANQSADQALRQQLGLGSQMFSEGMNSSAFATQMRQQQIAEEMQRRGFSLNEINSILSGQQVTMPNMPSFNTANRSEAPQYLQAAGMQGQYGIDQFNARQMQLQGLMSGIGGMAMGFGG